MLKQGSPGEARVSLPPSQALSLSVGVCERVGPQIIQTAQYSNPLIKQNPNTKN